jgi:hypothetical protein
MESGKANGAAVTKNDPIVNKLRDLLLGTSSICATTTLGTSSTCATTTLGTSSICATTTLGTAVNYLIFAKRIAAMADSTPHNGMLTTSSQLKSLAETADAVGEWLSCVATAQQQHRRGVDYKTPAAGSLTGCPACAALGLDRALQQTALSCVMQTAHLAAR